MARSLRFYIFYDHLRLKEKKATFNRTHYVVAPAGMTLHLRNKNKKGGKDQESIQSNTIPDPGHHIGK